MIYDIYSKDGNQKRNEFPIEAESLEELKAFIEVGMLYNLDSIQIRPAKTIKVSDLKFERRGAHSFEVIDEGKLFYSGFINKELVTMVGFDDDWQMDERTPLEVFMMLPNFKEAFDVNQI